MVFTFSTFFTKGISNEAYVATNKNLIMLLKYYAHFRKVQTKVKQKNTS